MLFLYVLSNPFRNTLTLPIQYLGARHFLHSSPKLQFTRKDTQLSTFMILLLVSQGVEVNPGPCHSENRHLVCAMCYLKSDRKISPAQEKLIQLHVNNNYSCELEGLPTGICLKCRSILNKDTVNFQQNEVQEKHAREGAVQWNATRSKDNCSCIVCEVASSKGGAYKRLVVKILMKEKQKVAPKLCPKCLTAISRGRSHVCGKSQKKKNIKLQADEVTKEEIAHEVLKSKLSKAQCTKGIATFQLRSGGRPCTYSVKRGRIAKKSVIRKESVQRGKLAAGLSNKQTKTFMQFVRDDVGEDGVEPGVAESLIEGNKVFKLFFQTEKVSFDVQRQQIKSGRGDRDNFEGNKTKGKKTEYVKSPVAVSFCNNVNGFYKELLEKRKIENESEMICKIGIDDGRGKLKVNMAVISRSSSPNAPVEKKKYKDQFKVILVFWFFF